MKKMILLFFLCFAFMINFSDVKAERGKVTIKGNFQYSYKIQKEGVWITNIRPLSNQGISTLKIPSKLAGKKVVKLGNSKDRMDSLGDNEPNLFGVEHSGEDDGTYVPADVYERVKKIKTIRIPETVKKITSQCFDDIPAGKNINIPKGVVENVEQFTYYKNWNKVMISPKNKKYKEVDGCLLTKNGKKLLGFFTKKKEMVIPKMVRTISLGEGDCLGVSTIVIPKGVNRIEELNTYEPITVKIAKGNRRYAVENGCIYSKVTGRLVSGYAKNGILNIPEHVTVVKKYNFLGSWLGGYRAKIIIVPSSVKEIHELWGLGTGTESHLTCVMKGVNPPKLVGSRGGVSSVTLYVPKGCKNKYLEKWKFEDYVKVTVIEQ